MVNNAEFSRRIARVLNSDYFYSGDFDPEKMRLLSKLQDELWDVQTEEDLPPEIARIIEEVESYG